MFNEKQFTEYLEKVREENHVAGMSVAITDGEKIIYKQGFGFESAMRPEVPAYADALFKIASMTKTLTAVMILRLCEEGTLHLDTPIKEYLPWLKLSRPEAEKTMTLRHLLTHTAGMPGDIWLEEGSRDDDTIDAVMQKLMPDTPLDSLPEENKYMYSSWGYNLIGTVASTVTGKLYTKMISEYVLDPLGMTTSTFDYQVASTYPLSLPHEWKADSGFRVDHYQRINTVYHAGAGLYSNATDMCKFARFLLRGGVTDSGERLISEESFRDMTAKYAIHNQEPKIYYGYGTFVRTFKDRYLYGHTGCYSPYNSSIFVDPKTGYGVVTFFNSSVTNIRNIIPEKVFEMLEENA
jgi:CubicO group peptidase (beta-lactamase class C family)